MTTEEKKFLSKQHENIETMQEQFYDLPKSGFRAKMISAFPGILFVLYVIIRISPIESKLLNNTYVIKAEQCFPLYSYVVDSAILSLGILLGVSICFEILREDSLMNCGRCRESLELLLEQNEGIDKEQEGEYSFSGILLEDEVFMECDKTLREINGSKNIGMVIVGGLKCLCFACVTISMTAAFSVPLAVAFSKIKIFEPAADYNLPFIFAIVASAVSVICGGIALAVIVIFLSREETQHDTKHWIYVVAIVVAVICSCLIPILITGFIALISWLVYVLGSVIWEVVAVVICIPVELLNWVINDGLDAVIVLCVFGVIIRFFMGL